MNAIGVKDEAHLNQLLADENFAAQEKLDGMRAIVHITRAGIRIFSRSAGVEDPTHPLEKTSALPHLAFQKYPQLAGTIIDGEILLPGSDSATLSGTVHSNTMSAANKLVKLFVFDILKYQDTNLENRPLTDRLYWLNILSTRMHSPFIVFLPWAFTSVEKRKLYNEVLAHGGEGIMLKRLDAQYLQGGRPANNWLKAKKSATFDCVVMGFTKGKGKYNDHIGAVVFGQYVDGKLTELGQASGMSDIIRQDMSASPHSYIGQVVTIKGMERLKSGAIRHPVYLGLRSDKLAKDCKWYTNEQ
jgi:bifunctional non-homologous end joining protein LigD